MTSSSSGFSSNSSTSSSTPVQTPQSEFLLQLGQYAQQLAGGMLNWANGAYQQTSNITGQAINNFFNVSKQMSGLSNTLTGQYNNLFAPENAQLVADANSYASAPRMAVDMGMAGATQRQANDAAVRNSEQQLLSYGIDPSAGRYAALDKAAAVGGAANVAGAMNQQRMADIQTGQNLRSQAVQVGSLLPGSIANVNNTALQANTGASNASLANASVGANLMEVANRYLQTAMGTKLPNMQTQSHSSGSSSNMSNSEGGGGGSSGGGGGGGSSGGGYGSGGGTSWSGMSPNTSAWGNDSGGGGYGGAPGIFNLGGGGGGPAIPGETPGGDPGGNSGDIWSSGSGVDYSGQGGGPGSLYDNMGSASGMGSGGGDGSDIWGSGSGQDLSGLDTSGGFAAGGSVGYDDGGDAAAGAVPEEASPSNGAVTDDVRANLNAGEQVIPRDVAAWKGQEFFHQLIAKSRATRAQMQAQMPTGGKPMASNDPRTRGPATFSTANR